MRLLSPDHRLAATDAIRRRDFRAAIAMLERDVEVRRRPRESLTMLAQCHEWLGEYADAGRYADRLLDGDPRDLRALKLAARCFGQLGALEHVYDRVCRALDAPPPPAGPVARVERVLALVPGLRGWMCWRAARRAADEAEWRGWAHAWKRWYEGAWREPDARVLH